MSVVHRVIILNKPLKIQGFSIGQWALMALGVAGGFIGAFNLVPKEWKILGAPAGVFVFVAIVGGVMVFVKACEMKPAAWWRNLLAYRLKLAPSVFLPRCEDGHVYPDPSIVEPGSGEERPYVS